jgi:hypothetical protein
LNISASKKLLMPNAAVTEEIFAFNCRGQVIPDADVAS